MISGQRTEQTFGRLGKAASLLHSSNSGQTWTRQSSPTIAALWAIHGEGDRLWAVGGDRFGEILHTVDGGQTWNHKSLLTNSSLRAIHGEGDRLWAVGESGVIVHTVDGGQTWKEQSSLINADLQAIHGEGDRLWAVGGIGIILIGTARGFHFQVSKVRLADQLTGASLELKFQNYSRFEEKTDVSGVQFELLGANEFNQSQNRYDTLETVIVHTTADSLTWQASFDPASFDVESGQDIYWHLTVTQDGFRQVYDLPALTYNRWGWVKEQWYWLALFGYVLGLPLVLGGLLLTRPLWVLLVYRKVKFGEVLDTVKKASPTLVWVARLLLSLFVVPFFIHHRRVLDAWVARHAGAVEERFKKLRTVHARLAYVPLPVRHGHRTTGTLFEQPSPEDLRPFFAARRAAVEMVGPGGSGKSTLAVQVGLWALHHQPEKRLAAHRMLPVLIEEDTQDLFGVIQRKAIIPLLNQKV